MLKSIKKLILSEYFIIFALYNLLFLSINYIFIFNNLLLFDFNDKTFQFLPDYKLLSNALNDRYIPFWTNQIGNGFPVLGYGYNSFLHPLHLMIALLIGDNISLAVLIMYYFIGIIGITSMYYALKLIKIESKYILLGVFIYYGTFHFSPSIHYYPLQMAYMFSPIISILFFKLSIGEYNEIKYSIILGTIGSLALLAFYPAYHIRFFGLLILISFGMISFNKNFKSSILLLLGSVFIMLLLLYPQIKITKELVDISEIGIKDNTYFYFKSINPKDILNIFGNIYFSSFAKSLDGWIYYYVPGIFVFLSLFSVLYTQKKLVIFFISLTILAIFLSFGEFNPFYRFLVENNLIFQQRIPSRFLLILNFTIPILSILGLVALIGLKDKYTLKKYIISLTLIFIAYFFYVLKKSEYNFFILYNNIDLSFLLLFTYLVLKNLQIQKNVENIFLFLLLIISIYHTYNFFTYKNIKNNLITEDSLVINKDVFKGINRIYSLSPLYQSLMNIGVQRNVFYGLDAADVYSQALKIKLYDSFLSEAKKELLQENKIEKLQFLGIDGIITPYSLNINYPYKKIDDNLYLYKLPRKEIVWKVDENITSLKSVKIKSENRIANDTIFEIELEEETDIVIFQNHFYFFDVYVNGSKTEPSLYYNFYNIKNLKKGINIVEIKFSYSKLLGF